MKVTVVSKEKAAKPSRKGSRTSKYQSIFDQIQTLVDNDDRENVVEVNELEDKGSVSSALYSKFSGKISVTSIGEDGLQISLKPEKSE